jgi:hypothetical protein
MQWHGTTTEDFVKLGMEACMEHGKKKWKAMRIE